MAKGNRRKKVASKPSRPRTPRQVKKDSLAFRSSLALARTTALFVDLHEKIKDFVFDDFEIYVDASGLKLDKPVPSPINKVAVMVNLVTALGKAFKDPDWGVDPQKFSLTGQELWSVTQKKDLSY